MDMCQSCLDEKKDKPELEIIELPCLHFVCSNCIRKLISERSTCLAGQTRCRGFLLVRDGETKEAALDRLDQEYQAALSLLIAITNDSEEKIRKRLGKSVKNHEKKLDREKLKYFSYQHDIIGEVKKNLPGCDLWDYHDLMRRRRNPWDPPSAIVIDPNCKIEYAIDQTTAYVWRKCDNKSREFVRTWSLETKGPWVGPHKAAPRAERPAFVASPLFTVPANGWVKVRNKSIRKQIDWSHESLEQPYDPAHDLALIQTQHKEYSKKKQIKLRKEQDKVHLLLKTIESDIETLKARIETGEVINPIVVHRINLRTAKSAEIREVKRLFRQPRQLFDGIPRTRDSLVFRLSGEESLMVLSNSSTISCFGRPIQLISECATSSAIIFGVLWVSGPTQTRGYDLSKHCIYDGNLPLVTFSIERPLGSFVLVDLASKVWHLTISKGGAALPYAIEE